MISPWTKDWQPELEWASPAGQTILEVARLVPVGTIVTVFGSSPLQLYLSSSFLSADVDCFGPPELKIAVEASGLGERSRAPYVQVSDELNFRTSPRWRERAHSVALEGRTIILPHPIDLLISKLLRLDPKDLRAFELVREKTGHPTEAELIEELQAAVDLYRPGFDEEQASDLKTTTRLLWIDFFGHDIDVVAQIIRPALTRRIEGAAQDNPKTDYKAMLLA